MIHLKKQVAFFLLARLNPELSRALCWTSIWYTRRPLSPRLSLSCGVNASNATPAKLHVNINCPAVLTKRSAINGNADEGALIASSKYSSSRFSQDRPRWFPSQSRAVFLVAFLSRGSHVTCIPMAWCCVESHYLRMSTSHVCPLVEPFFAFAFWGLKSSTVPGVVEASISRSTSAKFLGAELLL